MLIKVKVFPCSKEEGVAINAKDQYEVKVKEKPKQGLANQRVRQLLSAHFGIMENKVHLIKGARTQNKVFEIIK